MPFSLDAHPVSNVTSIQEGMFNPGVTTIHFACSNINPTLPHTQPEHDRPGIPEFFKHDRHLRNIQDSASRRDVKCVASTALGHSFRPGTVVNSLPRAFSRASSKW